MHWAHISPHFRGVRGVHGGQGEEDAAEAGVGAVDGGLPREPVDLLALPHGRGGVGISTVDEVAQVEVRVAPTAGVHVDMDQLRNAEIVEGAGEADVEAGLLPALT